MTFESDYDAVLTVKARRDRLDAAIATMAADSEFTPLVRRLGCLRGIGTLTGFALAVELGDWHRFTGNTIGSFVGLVPSEYSSGHCCIERSRDHATGDLPVRHVCRPQVTRFRYQRSPVGTICGPLAELGAKILRRRCLGMAQCNSAVDRTNPQQPVRVPATRDPTATEPRAPKVR